MKYYTLAEIMKMGVLPWKDRQSLMAFIRDGELKAIQRVAGRQGSKFFIAEDELKRFMDKIINQ